MRSERVLELGCGRSPDPRASIRTDVRRTDAAEGLVAATALPFRDASLDGILARHVVEHLDDPAAFFAEAARTLRPRGWVEFEVPLGGLARIDPTHRSEWTWETPEYFVEGGRWEYYYDLPLGLVERDLRVWLDAPLVHYLSPAFRAVATRYPGAWVSTTPWASGVMTVRMEHTGGASGDRARSAPAPTAAADRPAAGRPERPARRRPTHEQREDST